MARHRIASVRDVSPSAFVLRFERHGLDFAPGQYIHVGLPGSIDLREYSLYSAATDDYLEVLVKEIPPGLISPRLRRCRPGDELEVQGPFGFFSLSVEHRRRPALLVATGTGIAPFHSYVTSFPQLDYRLLHGVRTLAECYEKEAYSPTRYIACVSRGGGGFRGRVTAYLQENPPSPEENCFLCGNSAMIYEAFDLLKASGVPGDNLFAEVYF